MRTNFLRASPTTPNLIEEGECAWMNGVHMSVVCVCVSGCVCVCVCVCVWYVVWCMCVCVIAHLTAQVPTHLSLHLFSPPPSQYYVTRFPHTSPSPPLPSPSQYYITKFPHTSPSPPLPSPLPPSPSPLPPPPFPLPPPPSQYITSPGSHTPPPFTSSPSPLTVLRHQVPIGQMGNYQEHLKKLNPLRELDSGAVRTQLFGNPFKLERPADNKVCLLIVCGCVGEEDCCS